jgi:hypothetical protein
MIVASNEAAPASAINTGQGLDRNLDLEGRNP